MSTFATLDPLALEFVDRRGGDSSGNPQGRERRQFADSREQLSLEAQELGRAVDAYKVAHHRRFVTYEELLDVVKALGYHK